MRRAIFVLTLFIACAGGDSESKLITLQENSDRGHLQPSVFADLPASIRSDLEQRGSTVPQSEGINDIYVGKASVVWYWYGGRWLQLQGAD